jgi:hypothetical protein
MIESNDLVRGCRVIKKIRTKMVERSMNIGLATNHKTDLLNEIISVQVSPNIFQQFHRFGIVGMKLACKVKASSLGVL